MSDPVLVVSIDGLTPRVITQSTMPTLTGLASAGASCFSAQTVRPSVTVPAHMSMLRGVDPTLHGMVDNTPREPDGDSPSFLKVARRSGLRTAAVLNWLPLDCTIESDAVDTRLVYDAGYDAQTDRTLAQSAVPLLRAAEHDVMFAYLALVDVAGHEHGWDSEPYVRAATESDRRLHELVQAAGPETSVLVTTDHGGHGHDHGEGLPEDTEIFIVIRSNRVRPASGWRSVSILDVAPTVADLRGVQPAEQWTGASLIGTETATIDTMMELLVEMEQHEYGETVNMLDHSLQTAALAAEGGADDSLVLAGFLHDIGHMLGEAGDWGLPSHADVGARYLQALLPAAIVEPIRLHVAAKRYLVATDVAYGDRLSNASKMSLLEQGGPLSAEGIADFEANEHATSAVELRRCDDDGKVTGLSIPTLGSYRERLSDALSPRPSLVPSATWARDACRCAECRHPDNDQHLIDITDLDAWELVDTRADGDDQIVMVRHGEDEHRCVIPNAALGQDSTGRWHAHFLTVTDSLDEFVAGLDRFGIALATDVPTVEGAVLDFAGLVGFVRETNYGRLFDVITEPNPINLAYTPVGLPLHTDNPYRDPCPTVQLLHCIESANSGGANRFADGFHAANLLREQLPAAFETLATTPLLFRFHDDSVDLRATRTMIELDARGVVRAVAVNHRSMEPPSPSDCDVGAFYVAYRSFADLLASDECAIDVTLKPGDLVGFDNRRVLHGRTGFAPTARRHLQGCYIDIDAVRSRARMAASND